MISGIIKKLQHSSYIKGQRSIAEPPTTNRCLKTKGQVFFGKQKYFMKKNKTLCETESLVSCVGVKVRSLFNFVSFCRELLLSRFWLGGVWKVAKLALVTPACQKMFIWSHQRLGKLRTSLFEVSVVTQLWITQRQYALQERLHESKQTSVWAPKPASNGSLCSYSAFILTLAANFNPQKIKSPEL